MARFYNAFILFLMLPLVLHPQPQDIKFEQLNSYEGLSNFQITCITQDDDGFMWFGTHNGLFKYDGYKFTPYHHNPDDPNSLSYNWIFALYKDKTGNLWIGTFGGGLNKFDTESEKFIRYQHESDNIHSLSNNYIVDFYQDPHGDLWIGTQIGLSYLRNHYLNSDSTDVRFINYKPEPQDITSVSDNFVRGIYQSSDSTIWIGIADGSVYRLNRNRNKFTREITARDVFNYWNLPHHGRTYNSILYIDHQPPDTQNILTIGSQFGIFKYDYKKKKFIKYDMNIAKLTDNNVGEYFNDYYISEEGLIWAASTHGCYIVNPETDQLKHRKMVRIDSKNLSYGYISTIFQDRQGLVWVVGLGGGINNYDKNKRKISNYIIEEDTTDYSIYAILEDISSEGHIVWLGTKKHGIIKYDLLTNKQKNYRGEITHRITTICQSEDNLNYLWIGTLGEGLYLFDKQKESFSAVRYHDESSDLLHHRVDIQSPISLLITSLLIDKNGICWIGSLAGLYKFDPQNNKITSYLHDPTKINSINSNDVSALCASYRGNESFLWIGTRSGGLNKLDIRNEKFTHFNYNPADSMSVNANYISSIFEDKSGNLWIGTPRGLNRYNSDDNRFIRVIDKEKKLSAEIQSIMMDESENLWMNTLSGLHKFDPSTGNLRTYGDPFDRWSYHQSKNGRIYLANGSNLVSFNPEDIKNNPYIPPVVLTDFQIFNKSIKASATKDSPLSKAISKTESIRLSYQRSVFSFEFAALDYSDPANNKYAYKMENVDPDWVYTDASRRFATYTNLDPGEYTFKAKGSNKDGIWNEEGISINVIITPPWWKTKWAYTVYVFLCGFVIIGLWRFQINRMKIKQQIEMQYYETEKLREVDHFKSRFIANISHEFRTPLTLIEGPVKQLLSGLAADHHADQYHLILRNTKRLLKMVNQLLDLSRLDAGQMTLRTSLTPLIPFLRGITMTFASKADMKNIKLEFKAEKEDIPLYLDRDKFETIVINLLSNAFNYTPDKGKIIVSTGLPRRKNSIKDINEKLYQKETTNSINEYILIMIANSGPLIPDEHLDKIFDRFYHSDKERYSDQKGTGIGLALTKELVELHQGWIQVTSNLNEGTVFTIALPIGCNHLQEEQIIEVPTKDTEIEQPGSMIPLERSDTQIEEVQNDKLLIMIVEDNVEVRQFIRSALKDCYRFTEASEGKQGFQKAIDEIPDLIISDIMMPEMDGYEFCKKIRMDERTSHIPFVFLTARAGSQDKMLGLETGADEYLVKPFSSEELIVRIQNIMEHRKTLRERFIREFHIQTTELSLKSLDDNFLNRFLKIIDENISDPEFDVDKILQNIYLSRAVLYRKIKALTGQSVKQFIRTIRLRRAALILSKDAASVTQTAYEVGFKNPAYFSECFQNQYGLSPSKFAHQCKKTNQMPH